MSVKRRFHTKKVMDRGKLLGFRWEDIDRTIVSPKLSELSAEMHDAFLKDENEIAFEARKRGNSAYFLPTFLDKQVERTAEWARKKYEIYCECWHEQGGRVTPEFIRAVSKNAIALLMHVRKRTVTDHLTRVAQRTGRPLNQHCLDRFRSSMDRLANTWLRGLEAEAKALEQNSLVLPHPGGLIMSIQQTREATLDCEARLTEINIAIDAQKQALALTNANGGPATKILQAIRRLSLEKVTLEKRLKEYELLREQLEKSSIEIETKSPSKRKRAPRAKALCFETAIALLTKKPNLTLIQFCREMDSNAEKFQSASKYCPPDTWKVRTFYEQYQKRSNTVSRFVSAVRSEIARRVHGTM